MAVPVQGAKQILEAILKTMAGVTYEGVPANLASYASEDDTKRILLKEARRQ